MGASGSSGDAGHGRVLYPHDPLIGTRVDDAATAWAAKGLDVRNINISLGQGNYTIESELGGDLGQPLVSGQYDGTSQNCATFVLTVVGP